MKADDSLAYVSKPNEQLPHEESHPETYEILWIKPETISSSERNGATRTALRCGSLSEIQPIEQTLPQELSDINNRPVKRHAPQVIATNV